MQDVFYIESIEQAMALLKPMRIELLKQLGEPRTCPELADVFGESVQKVYYHVKALEEAGLVEKTDERRVRGTVEGHYQAKARSYWLAPELVGKIGGTQTSRDQSSLRVILEMTEDVQREVGHLGHRTEAGQHVPSLALSAHIHLPNAARRAEFLAEVQQIFQKLARDYGTPDGDLHVTTDEQGFRLVLVCYPKNESPET